MSSDNKVTKLSPTLAELYGAAYDAVRSRHPETYPPWGERYIERVESASHVYKRVSGNSGPQGIDVLQKVLITGDKNPLTKAKEKETVRLLREAIEKEKGGSKTAKKRVKG